jgi:pimeloyl-ACP methyl ester carboxylesterase
MTIMFAEHSNGSIQFKGRSIEIVRKGKGPVLLYLHAGHGVSADAEILERLSTQFAVIAPSHPGFGESELDERLTTVEDLAFFYIELIRHLDLRDVTLVGASFGGWIAAEIATIDAACIAALILIAPLGAKFNARNLAQFPDLFLIEHADFPELLFHDARVGMAAFGGPDFDALSEATVLRFARNEEALMRFGWSPLLHNPKLQQRLSAIRVPTLILRGSQDRVAPAQYAQSFADAIPGARLTPIEAAGHYADTEQPAKVADAIFSFTANLSAASAKG